ncbi:MAG: response regulator transcription factor [Planctomycetota bacterium]|jgi:FixJ family two-component response regulator
MKSEPTVFVVDADGPTRDAVRDLVHTMNLQCEAYALGRDFLDSYTDSRPGCLVLEVRIPDINGFEIQDRLVSRGDATPVVFLTSQATVSIAVRAMRAGALHFIEKPFRENELWDTIQEAMALDRQRRYESMHRAGLQKRLEQLTQKERHVVEMIAQGKSKKAIAADVGVCVRTIELRRNRLMKKLGMSSPVELVRFALMACNGQRDGCHEMQHV